MKRNPMSSIDHIRKNIIDRLATITNKEYLKALYKLVERGPSSNEKIKLTEEQKIMLRMSEEDIKLNRVISQEKLDKEDLEWLKKI